MPYLVFFSYCFNPSGSHNYMIDDGNNFDFICTVRFLFKELAFLHRVKAIFIWIAEQIIGFSMGQMKVVQYGLPITFRSVSQAAFDAVF